MAIVVALVDDLMFLTRIRTAAGKRPVEVRRVGAGESLSGACERDSPSLVVVDLDGASRDPIASVAALRGERPEVRVVGFVSHVREDLIQAARGVGCEVLSRGEFVRELPGLLAALP
jgi:ActR/RegA family two-component response regulator